MDTHLSLPGKQIPQSQHLGRQVLSQLRRLIITNELPVGTHLVESQLAASFNVSRGPIRDALTQLEVEGLVESRPRGVFTLGLSIDDIDELYSLREDLERMAIRITAHLNRHANWIIAQPSLERMKRAASKGDHADFARADLAFHSSLFEAAAHQRLKRIWQQYEPTFEVLLAVTTAEDIDLIPSYESHLEIYQKIKNGELDGALVSLQEHLLGSRNRLISAYRRFLKEG